MDQFKKIFEGLQRAHGCTYVDKKGADGLKIKGKSFVKREIVTDLLWDNHLKGIEPSLGIIPINEDNKCVWGCIDVDKYDNLDHKQIIKKIDQYLLPLFVCRSKSGGAHIFLFTKDFVPAKLMRDKLMSISAILGFGNAEVFPKQIELKSEDDTGNFLNLPYFNCKNTTRYCYDKSGQAVTITAFLDSIKQSSITPKELEELQVKRPPSEFSDGPPCLESLTREKLSDTRDRVMYQFIIYAKKKWPDEWQEKLNPFNYKYFNPPLADKKIEDKKKNFDKKEFGYKCEEEPMCNHCDKQLCKTRPFGIGKQILFPHLSDLQIIETEEKEFRLNVDGQRVSLKADHLAEQNLFRKAMIDQVYVSPPKLKPEDFRTLVQNLLDNKEIVKAPQGSSKIDQLGQHLENYCTSLTAEGSAKEDIENGNVWNYQGHHHFSFHIFYHQYLSKRKWKTDYDRTLFWLKDNHDCDTEHRMMVGKKKLQVVKLKQFQKQEQKIKKRTFKKEDAF